MSLLLLTGGAVSPVAGIEWFFQWNEDDEPEHHEDIYAINVFDEETGDYLYSFTEEYAEEDFEEWGSTVSVPVAGIAVTDLVKHRGFLRNVGRLLHA